MLTLNYRNSYDPNVRRELEQAFGVLNAFLKVSFDEEGNLRVPVTATVSGVGFPVGAIIAYGNAVEPAGWLVCDGRPVSRTTYAALFATLGVLYGSGNGSTTFNIPDLRGRFPLGKATSGTGAVMGSTGGLIDHVHSGPSHTHTTGAPSDTTGVTTGGTAVASATHTHTTDAQGAGNTGTANPPFQTITYIILAQ